MRRPPSTAGVWGTIDSQRVAFPTTSHDMSLLQADFTVPTDAVRSLLAEPASTCSTCSRSSPARRR